MKPRGPLRILNREGLLDYLAMSRPTLYRRVAEGLFPPGFPISGRGVGWLEREAEDYATLLAGKADESEVRAWVSNVIAARTRLSLRG